MLEETTTSSFTGDNSKDVYPVTLKISVVREPQKMAIKISKKVCFSISMRKIKRKSSDLRVGINIVLFLGLYPYI